MGACNSGRLAAHVWGGILLGAAADAVGHHPTPDGGYIYDGQPNCFVVMAHRTLEPAGDQISRPLALAQRRD
jgi:hypothetical protein